MLQDGAFSSCIAIVSNEPPALGWMNELGETAKAHFQHVFIQQLGDGNLKSFSGSPSDLLLIYGFERCDPQSPEAHSVRSSLDVQGGSGIASVICLDKAAYERHFCDIESPFYKFCGIVDQDSICDLSTEVRQSQT